MEKGIRNILVVDFCGYQSYVCQHPDLDLYQYTPSREKAAVFTNQAEQARAIKSLTNGAGGIDVVPVNEV